MAEVSIRVLDRGPYLIQGPVTLLDGAGQTHATGEQVALCRCGRSANKPFCDGQHQGSFDHCWRAEDVL